MTLSGGKMSMKESTVVENPKKDTTGTQGRSLDKRDTSRGKWRVLQIHEKMKTADMYTRGRRAHGTGEVTRKGIEEMRGTGRREGKETDW